MGDEQSESHSGHMLHSKQLLIIRARPQAVSGSDEHRVVIEEHKRNSRSLRSKVLDKVVQSVKLWRLDMQATASFQLQADTAVRLEAQSIGVHAVRLLHKESRARSYIDKKK